MAIVKNSSDIEKLRQGGAILAEILSNLSYLAVPGITTKSLGEEAMRLAESRNVKPSFLGYRPHGAKEPYPAAVCVSVNDEIVHALPSEKKLAEGDILSIDMGIWHDGLCVDAAITVGVGKISQNAAKLIKITRESLDAGIGILRAGVRTGDIGYAISNYVEKNGFQVVRDLAGHGVGENVHEDPIIFNFGKKGVGEIIPAGSVLALEPMVVEKDWHIKTGSDGWAIKTADGGLAAHFEHTVLVTENGYEILTEIKES